jgi:hypothetical protein
MAILELYKGRAIEMSQTDNYGDILVEAKAGAPVDDIAAEGFADESGGDSPRPEPGAPVTPIPGEGA